MSGQAEQEDPLAKATRAAEDLYQLRDTYFPANPDEKLDKLQRESDLAIKLLDSIPLGKFQSSSIPNNPIALFESFLLVDCVAVYFPVLVDGFYALACLKNHNFSIGATVLKLLNRLGDTGTAIYSGK